MNNPTQPTPTKERKPRLPRYRRVEKDRVPRLMLQERDLEILKTIWQYRYLTSNHFLYLIKGSRQKIYQRLQKLFHNGYLCRLHFPIFLDKGGSSPAIYALDRAGAELLVEYAGLPAEKIKWTYSIKTKTSKNLKHALMISNFRAVLSLAIQKYPNVRLVWRQGNVLADKVKEELRTGKTESRPFVPDAYFEIIDLSKPEEDGTNPFFLECDRTTMTSGRYQKKMRNYWIYWGRGEGKFNEKYNTQHFRVLTVTQSEKRTQTLIKATQKADDSQTGSRLYLFTEENKYSLKEPDKLLGEIWRTARTPGKTEGMLS